MCSEIVQLEPTPFQLPVTFASRNLERKTKIYLRVEDRYISCEQDEQSRYVMISGFPRFLEGQQSTPAGLLSRRSSFLGSGC
jgi:hypothetical protein